jgi:hypothetical protein
VLDERHAFDEALGHARAQLAQYVATKVTAEACLQDLSDGTRFLPFNHDSMGRGEVVDQYIRSRVHEYADAIVGGLVVHEQYWEQWSVPKQVISRHLLHVEEGHGLFRRYKCWVLTKVDQATVDGYVRATLAAWTNSEELARAEAANANLAAEAEAANANLAAEAEAGLVAAGLQVAASVADLNAASAALTAQSWELQRARERIHYGRRFRLNSQEDCLHFRPSCDFSRLHPEWKAPEYLLQTQVVVDRVLVDRVLVGVQREADTTCRFCPDTNCSH